ncbi:MAG: hypothetical protein HXS40_03765 [Theionarchaea archaeon]|nr:hypothetical protein [Theionarchaea archaeon]
MRGGDYMVSWGRAFKGAAGVVGFSIIWWFVGGILIGIGMFLAGFGFLFSSTTASFMGTVLGVVLIFIGSIIGMLGTIASFLKVLPEIVAEEIQKA